MSIHLGGRGPFHLSPLGVGSAVAPPVTFYPTAVSLTPDSYMNIGKLGTTDTPYGLVVLEVRGGVGSVSDNANLSDWSVSVRDIISNNGSSSTYTSESVPGLNIGFDNAGGTTGTIRVNLNDSSGANSGLTHTFQFTCASVMTQYNAEFTQIAVAWDLTTSTPRYAIAINGTPVTPNSTAGTPTAGMLVNLANNARGFMLGGNAGNGGPCAFDLGRLIVDNSQAWVDASNLFTGGLLAKIWSNTGRIDFGSDASTILGYKPLLFLDGDKTTRLTNKGSSAAAIAMATLQSAAPTPSLCDAPYGPGGPSDGRPYRKYISAGQFTAGTSSGSPSNRGMPIKLGQLLMISCFMVENSQAFNRNIGFTSGSGTAFQKVTATGDGFPQYFAGIGGYTYNSTVIWKIAEAADVTASGAAWTNAPTFTWATNGTNFRTATYEMMVFDGVNASTPIMAAANVSNAATPSIIAPSVTPTGAKSTLVSLYGNYDPGDGVVSYPVASGQRIGFKTTSISTSSVCCYVVADEAITGTSATGTRTAGCSQSHPWVAASILLGP